MVPSSTMKPHSVDRDNPPPIISTLDSESRLVPELAIVVISVGAPPEVVDAVQSIFDLKTPCEVIVVNSGGGDMRQRMGPLSAQVTIVEHEAVLWAGEARNLGIKASSAPYIAFLAADCTVCPGWIDERMALHHQGYMAVASAVVGTQSWNPIAWASHFSLFGNRLPDVPAKDAAVYGVSYDRQLFVVYGMFRGDLRIGEDTEFNRRLPAGERPVWAPRVLTAHSTPSNPASMLGDQFRRGERSGRYWFETGENRFRKRIYKRLRALAKILYKRSYNPDTRLKIIGHLPLLVLNIVAYELGLQKGRKNREQLVEREAAAYSAERAKKWADAGAIWQAAAELSPDSPTLKLNQIRCLRMAGLIDEAMAVCDQVERDYPQLIAPAQERARIHQRVGAWQKAIAGWDQLVERHPRSGQARLNLADALAATNDWQGARMAYEAARELMPKSRAPIQGLVAVASAQDDSAAVLDLYHTLWDQFSDDAALVNWIDLLLKLGRRNEALALVSQVETSATTVAKKLAARATLLYWDHDWEGIVALLNKHPRTVARSRRLLGLQINSLCFLNRQADAYAVIARKGVSKGAAKGYTLDIQLRFGDYDAAWPQLAEKLERGEIDEIATHYASPLIIGAYEQFGIDRARAIITSLARGPHATIRGEILRLSLPYHKARVESLAWLEGEGQPAIMHPERKVVELISEAGLQALSPDSYDNLKTVSRAFGEMRRTAPDVFPDPIYSLSDALAVVGRIRTAIDASQPLSLVRLGDGEGRFFPYPPHLENFLENDRIASTQVWWNMGGTDTAALDDLGVMIPASADASDILGIPDLSRVIRGSSVGTGRPVHGFARNARGLLAVINYVSTIVRRSAEQAVTPPMITSCHIHEALAFWGLWPPLLRYMREISLITCHPNLPDALRNQFGVETKTLHLIPAESKYAPLFGHEKPSEPHFPDVFRRMEQKLASTTPGDIVLVAAGALGKIYCQRVREAGGIAIDIGSVADYWCGFITRGYDETFTYRSPAGLPALYESLASCDPDFGRFWHGRA